MPPEEAKSEDECNAEAAVVNSDSEKTTQGSTELGMMS